MCIRDSYALSCGVSYIHPEYSRISEAEIDGCRIRGIGVNAWTVNEPDHMLWLIRKGVGGIITNPVSYTHLDVYKRQFYPLKTRRTADTGEPFASGSGAARRASGSFVYRIYRFFKRSFDSPILCKAVRLCRTAFLAAVLFLPAFYGIFPGSMLYFLSRYAVYAAMLLHSFISTVSSIWFQTLSRCRKITILPSISCFKAAEDRTGGFTWKKSAAKHHSSILPGLSLIHIFMMRSSFSRICILSRAEVSWSYPSR